LYCNHIILVHLILIYFQNNKEQKETRNVIIGGQLLFPQPSLDCFGS
jgi:hypothetical protein